MALLHIYVECPGFSRLGKLFRESRSFWEDRNAPRSQMLVSIGQKAR